MAAPNQGTLAWALRAQGQQGNLCSSPFALLPDAQKQSLLLAMQRKGNRGDAQVLPWPKRPTQKQGKQGLQRQEARVATFALGA